MGYMVLLDEYQSDKKELLGCGISVNDFFMTADKAKQAVWCNNASEEEVQDRINLGDFPAMQCNGTRHSYWFQEEQPIIKAHAETVKPSPPDKRIQNAITKMGMKCDLPENYSDSLQAIKTELDDNPDTIHWLVTTEASCKDYIDPENRPFWLVEEQQANYRILLAYQGHHVKVKMTKHAKHNDIWSSYKQPTQEAEITWHYSNGEYAYADSECTNVSRIDDSEPLFIEDCLEGETWH